MHRALAFTAIMLLVALAAVGCKGDKRNEALTGDAIIRAANSEGVSIAITNIRQNRRYVVLNVDITNGSEKTVELRNPGDIMRGFTIESAGRSVGASARHGGNWNPWTGYRAGSESSASGVMAIPPSSTGGVELHFRWPKPYPEQHNYPWTLTVSQMYFQGGDEALSPIVHSEPLYGN